MYINTIIITTLYDILLIYYLFNFDKYTSILSKKRNSKISLDRGMLVVPALKECITHSLRFFSSFFFVRGGGNEKSSSSDATQQEQSRRFLRVNLSLQTEYQQNGESLTD